MTPIDAFAGTVEMQPLLVYGTVNVDVSSALLRPDNASVLKGNILSAWYWFGGIKTGQSRKVVWYRVFFALFSTNSTRQKM